MLSNDQDETGPLHLRVREALAARIAEDRYPPGERLPSEHTLCGMFGVSRITVRKALADMEREGAIERIHGKGTFVARPKAFQVVTELQGFAEAMTPLGHEVRNQLHGFRYFEASPALATRLELDAGAQVAEISRVRLLDGRPLSFESTYVAAALGRQLAGADLVTRDLFAILEADLGRAPGHAQIAIEAALADENLAGMLEVPAGAPLLRVERHVFDAHGVPLVFERLLLRADTFQYRMRIDRLRNAA